jgi:hypothetical protein
MKFQFDFFIPLVIVSLVLISCEYQLDSNNFRNLQKPDSTMSIQVEITPEEFPEVLDKPVQIKYKFYPGDLSLLGVRILVDDNYTLFESTQVQDSFLVSPYDFEPGNRKLSIEFIMDSKSESLADLTGYEALVFRRDWEFYKPDICYSGICISKVFNDDGMLKIVWDTTSLPGFRKYKIYKMCEFFDSTQVVAEITNRNNTEFDDCEYFGGWADYSVEAETESGTMHSLTASAYYLFPRLEVLWVRDNDIQMYWNKSAFDKVVLGYELSYADSDTTTSVLFTTDNPMDTTYLLDGTPTYNLIKYTLRIKIRGPESGQSMWSDFSTFIQLTYMPKYYLKK